MGLYLRSGSNGTAAGFYPGGFFDGNPHDNNSVYADFYDYVFLTKDSDLLTSFVNPDNGCTPTIQSDIIRINRNTFRQEIQPGFEMRIPIDFKPIHTGLGDWLFGRDGCVPDTADPIVGEVADDYSLQVYNDSGRKSHSRRDCAG